MDYVIADQHVLPLSEQRNWTEQIVHMPCTYYPNDRARPIPPLPSPEGRASQGLPETGFVFCCFNNNFKITREVFILWMRLLRELPGSVLWLYEGNTSAASNLRKEARNNGIEPHRLIFAKPAPFEEHVKRHAYADLFLDTTPYGAHTTGADALWACVPIVALSGRSFASRVCASMLHAVALPELICETPDAYLSLASALARDPRRMLKLRRRLVEARTTSSLFDARRFASDLECAFTDMAAISRSGSAPQTIRL